MATPKTVASRIIALGGNAKRTFLALHELTLEQDGKQRPYYMVTRGDDEPLPDPKTKLPDAVVIVAIIRGDDGKKRLVMTNEYRAAIGARELSFPAGLIDPADGFDKGFGIERTAANAAKREFFEETGLEFEYHSCSPENLYSSAGMTNESIMIVFGSATGTPTTKHNESTEDIEIMLLDDLQLSNMVKFPPPDIQFSKVGWPIMWAYDKIGLENV